MAVIFLKSKFTELTINMDNKRQEIMIPWIFG